ncbi:MAG: hypothetical protein N2651_06860 [Fimbriimonadales bacterium]|nr:hypothetical protein [Fimbriimonadales bacterium]
MDRLMGYRDQARPGVRRCVVVAFFALSASLGALTTARGQAIYWISSSVDFSPSSMSSSATYVAGVAYDTNTAQWVAARWSAQSGVELLPSLAGYGSTAHAISADGKVIVGHATGSLGQWRPFRWVEGRGIQDLGSLGGEWGVAWSVSADGQVVVGVSGTASDENNPTGYERAFRWHNGTMQDLGTLGGNRSEARAVSADGSVVVGDSETEQGARAFRWTAQSGMQNLGVVSGGSASFARAVSADGKVIVGHSAIPTAQGHSRNYAFRWSAETGMQSLGVLDGIHSYASAVSGDGRVVVGVVVDASRYRAFIWKPETGMQYLEVVYAHLLPNGERLSSAVAISPSGRYILGWGSHGAYILDTCPGGDTDADCICDDWERNGLDINNDGVIDLNLPALGATVGRRDIFIEYDSMSGQRPSQAVLDAVRAAFRNRQVYVHFIDGGDHAAPATNWSNVWQDYDAFKTQYYGTPAERNSPNWQHIRRAKRKFVRYCVFAKSYGSTAASGIAELPGDDIIVSLGHSDWSGLKNKLPMTWKGRRVTWDDHVAGTLMHEIGHALGQRHGGCDHVNFKPNYYSVMNYLWQMPQPGYAPSWLLDYSTVAYESLNENDLSEPDGIGGASGKKVPVGGLNGWLADMRGPVDWNQDGDTTDTGVVRDINGDNQHAVLCGFNNWAFLDCSCDGVNWQDGVRVLLAGIEADQEEMTFADWRALSRIGMPRADTDFDGCVDDADLLAVLFAFGSIGGGLLEDLDEDGVVDDADLLLVLFNFGSGC